MESYPRGRRGVPAKDVVVSKPARVQIPHSPPIENCRHIRENEKGVQFFFLHECFGIIIPFNKPKVDNAGWENWKTQKRDNYGNWIK